MTKPVGIIWYCAVVSVVQLSQTEAAHESDHIERSDLGYEIDRRAFTPTLEREANSTFLQDDVTTSDADLEALGQSGRIARLLHPACRSRTLGEDDIAQVLDYATGLVSVNGLKFQPSGRRPYARLFRTQAVEAWVIAWASSTYLGLHDHGGSRAEYHVVAGTLYEASTALSTRAPLITRPLQAGARRSLGSSHVHELWNPSPNPALSVHAYSPPLHSLSFYIDHGSNYLTKIRTETDADWPNPEPWTEGAIG